MVARRPPLPHSSAHGLLVTHCGDVALNPGPPPTSAPLSPSSPPPLSSFPQRAHHQVLNGGLRITSANITSLLSQFDVASHLPGDILALQETRMGEGAQRHMTRALAERGWAVVWGHPMPLISLAPGSSPTMWSMRGDVQLQSVQAPPSGQSLRPPHLYVGSGRQAGGVMPLFRGAAGDPSCTSPPSTHL